MRAYHTKRPQTQKRHTISFQLHRARNVLAKVPAHAQAEVKAAYWAIFDNLQAPPGQAAVNEATRRAEAFATRYQHLYPSAVACLISTLSELTTHLRFLAEHRQRIRHTDERFKTLVALSAGWDEVSLLGGRGRPRSQEQGRGAGSPAAQLAP
jgi:Transposase, Mutator family